MIDVFFVADDFTGGVDVLLQAARCDEPATMFLSVDAFLAADEEELPTCTGVATTFRRSTPAEVNESLTTILDRGMNASPRVVQYKICSTADSSPSRGSVRPAYDEFRRRGAKRVALWPAQPNLRRYTAFGHHFANDRGAVYRLDRQPTMANHPSTPMRESDLRLHFADQTGDPVGSITLEDLRDASSLEAAWNRENAAGRRLVLVDVVRESDATAHGIALVQDVPAFVIGSGGATLGLGVGLGWQETASPADQAPAASGPVLVVAGSCSQLTATQIAHVEQRPDWVVLPCRPGTDDPTAVAAEARSHLVAGRHVVVHSGGATEAVTAGPETGAGVPANLTEVVEVALGHFARLIVAGGDTSGDVLTLLGATRLTTAGMVGRDTCLCLVQGMADDDVEVILKGGQIGSVDFFVRAAQGEGVEGNADRQT